MTSFQENEDRAILKLPSAKSGKSAGSLKLKAFRKALNSLKQRGARGKLGNFKTSLNYQYSIVQVSYSKNKHPGQWKSHGRYLERQGAQKNEEKSKGFDEQSEDVQLSQKLDVWQKENDEYVFKIIVSPEQAERLNLREHTRELMIKIENDFGAKLEWAAVDHYNTDQPHVHVVIRGKDKNGQTFRISKDYIKQGIRQHSRSIATQQLGIRLKKDILIHRDRAIKQNRVTELDREIDRLKDHRNIVNLGGLVPSSDYQVTKRSQTIARLQYLETIGFANHSGHLSWQVSPHYIEGLKAYQQSQDIIKRKAQHIGNILNPSLPLVNTKLKEGESIIGRVVGVGLHNEIYDQRYVLIESKNKVHYIHPSKKMSMDRDAFKIKNGDMVKLEMKSFEKVEGEDKRKITYMHVKKLEPTVKPIQKEIKVNLTQK